MLFLCVLQGPTVHCSVVFSCVCGSMASVVSAVWELFGSQDTALDADQSNQTHHHDEDDRYDGDHWEDDDVKIFW